MGVKRVLPTLILVVLLVGYSLLSAKLQQALPGFSPIPALFFCVAACLAWKWLGTIFAAWLIAYPLTNWIYGYGWNWQVLLTIAGFGLAVAVGASLRGSQRVPMLLAGSVGAAILFYVLSNTGSWLLLPDYPKNWTGFVQAQWTGAPHHALDTWVFLRNGILAHVLFTGLFLLGHRQWGGDSIRVGEPAPVRIRR